MKTNLLPCRRNQVCKAQRRGRLLQKALSEAQSTSRALRGGGGGIQGELVPRVSLNPPAKRYVKLPSRSQFSTLLSGDGPALQARNEGIGYTSSQIPTALGATIILSSLTPCTQCHVCMGWERDGRKHISNVSSGAIQGQGSASSHSTGSAKDSSPKS